MVKAAIAVALAGFLIVAHQDERWRAGRKFTREPLFVSADELAEDDLEALKADPLLSVSDATQETQVFDEAAAEPEAKVEPKADAKADEKADAKAAAKDAAAKDPAKK